MEFPPWIERLRVFKRITEIDERIEAVQAQLSVDAAKHVSADHTAFGQKIHRMRTSQGQKIAQLAEALNIPHSAIFNIESGQGKVNSKHLAIVHKWVTDIEERQRRRCPPTAAP
jgi:DNA-binding transcriptional regulator YiaG